MPQHQQGLMDVGAVLEGAREGGGDASCDGHVLPNGGSFYPALRQQELGDVPVGT